MDLFAKPIDSITFQDVVDFCNHQIKEHVSLDYKGELSSKDPRRKIAKIVSSMANTEGGVIIWGVPESKNDRTPVADPKGEFLGKNPHAAILNSCASLIFPHVALEVSEYLLNPENNDKGFVVARVLASHDIHLMDGGSTIYLRISDQSMPFPNATTVLDNLLERRKEKQELSRRRRLRISNLLDSLFPTGGTKGLMQISIGPRPPTRAFFELRQLKFVAENCGVPSGSHNWRKSPISSLDDAQGVADALCHVDRRRKFGGAIDVFGNVFLKENLKCRIRGLKAEYPLGQLLTNESSGEHCLLAAAVIERIITALRLTSSILQQAEYVGDIEGEIVIKNARGIQLIKEVNHGLPIDIWVLGECGSTDILSIPIALNTIDIADNVNLDSCLRPIVGQLLWAWGSVDDGEIDPLIHTAECLHYGSETCACGNYQKPHIRDSCLACRKKLDEIAT